MCVYPYCFSDYVVLTCLNPSLNASRKSASILNYPRHAQTDHDGAVTEIGFARTQQVRPTLPFSTIPIS